MIQTIAFAQRAPVIVRTIGAMLAIVRDSGGGFVYDCDEDLREYGACRLGSLMTSVAPFQNGRDL